MPAKIVPRHLGRLDFYDRCVMILRLSPKQKENSVE